MSASITCPLGDNDFMILARWRSRSMLFVLLPLLAGCAGRGSEPIAKGPATPSGPRLTITVGNRGRQTERFVVRVDDKNVFDATVAPGQTRSVDPLPLKKGWVKVNTKTDSGINHQAMVEGNRDKWVRILREPTKPEGVGVHITEYPVR
jgi:hypothetical protein